MLSPTTPTPSTILDSSRISPLDPIQTSLSSPSLSSTRPAPPSPADSRRTSTLSARSTASKPSTPGSGTNSRRGSRSSFGHGLGFTSTSTGTGSKRQSTLGALSTMSGNAPLSPQKEGEENLPSSDTAVDSLTTPTSATATSTAVITAAPDIPQPSAHTETPTTPAPMKDNQNYRRSTRVKIKIRDFAYGKVDDRYRGMGTDVPKPNRFARLNKKLGGSKKIKPSSRRWSLVSDYTTEEGDIEMRRGSKVGRYDEEGDDDDDDDDNEEEDDDDDDDDEDSDGWFRRGMGRFSWSFGLANLRRQIQLEQEEEERQKREKEQQLQQQQQQQQQQSAYPTRGEMELNFGSEDNGESSGTSSTDVYYDTREHQHEVDEDPESLRSGTYRAIFAFDPEGPTEMRLYEDQLVHVVGRGGEGWAVVIVPNEEEDDKDSVGGGSMQTCGVEIAPGLRHALVPESYLEAVELD